MLPSSVERIDDARRWLSERLRAGGFGDNAVWALELALTEAVSNVIRHSYDDEPNHEVHLSLELDGDKATLEVLDFGRGFDPATVTRRDLGEPGPGGYGLHLLDEVLDEVERESSPGRGTRLRLVKYRLEENHG